MDGNDVKSVKSKNNGMKICGIIFLIAGILLAGIGLLLFPFKDFGNAEMPDMIKPIIFLAVGVFFSIGIGGSCLLLWAIGRSNMRKKASEADLQEDKETVDDPREETTDDPGEEEEQPFNVYRDYVFDARFADFAKHDTQIIDENGKSHGYKMAPDKSVEQLIIEKTVLGKKLGKAAILFLIGIASLVITTVLPNLLVQHMDMDLLRTLYYTIGGIGSVIGIIGACKLARALSNPIRVGDILNYSDAIDKKMQKNGGEGDLERWRERLKKLREAQEK